MNESPSKVDSIVAQARQERLSELLRSDFEFVDKSKEPRKYQSDIMKKTIADLSKGNVIGRWDIAVGGGKTYMAHSLAQHIAKRGGRILYLAAGNPEIENAISAHESSGLGEDNYVRFHDRTDFEMLNKPKIVSQLSDIPYFYSTVQLMTYDDRFKSIPPDFFDLTLYDESQDFLGSVMKGPSQHFLAAQVHMSATPFTMRQHVGDRVPHVYGGITSPELIKEYGFPKWMIHNYHVEDVPFNTNIIENGEFDFENNDNLHRHLNLSRRFEIIEQILEQAVVKNKKSICTVPSVRDAELFVQHFVASNPILYGRIDYVAGNRGNAVNKKVKEKLESGELLGVIAKDLWDQSVDIPDVEHVILGDPSRSLRKTTQRIGRGVRPAPGKSALHIHDLVSTVFHSRQIGAPAIRADELIESQIKSGGSSVNKKSIYQSRAVSEVFLTAVEHRKDQNYFTRVCNMEMSEQFESADFLADPEVAIDVFKTYAHEVFGVSPIELLVNIDKYKKSVGVLMYKKGDTSYALRLQDFIDTCEFYATLSSVTSYDYFSDLANSIFTETDDYSRTNGIVSMKERALLVPIDARLAPAITEGFNNTFSHRVNYIGALNTATQVHDIVLGPPKYRSYISNRVQSRDVGPKFETEAIVHLKDGRKLVITSSRLHQNKSDSKQECALQVIQKLTEIPDLAKFFKEFTFGRRVSQKDEEKALIRQATKPEPVKQSSNVSIKEPQIIPHTERLSLEVLKTSLPLGLTQHPADYLNWLKANQLCNKVKRNTKPNGDKKGLIKLSVQVGNRVFASNEYAYSDGPRDKNQYYQMCLELLEQVLGVPKIHTFLSKKIKNKSSNQP